MGPGEARRKRRNQKPNSIVSNELIVDDLYRFLDGRQGGAVLDLGAGRKPYHDIYAPHFDRCVALDVDDSRTAPGGIDVVAPADDMPFADESFDCVIATEVLEHCRDPLATLSEIRRVLADGGEAFITTPFMLGLHEQPYDYYRYTPYALTDLAERAGLHVRSIKPRGNLLAVALAVLQWPISKLLARTSIYRYRNPVTWVLLVAPQRMYLAYWRARGVRRRTKAPLGFHTVLRRI
jgi:SAM-dependent methyltransferase